MNFDYDLFENILNEELEKCLKSHLDEKDDMYAMLAKYPFFAEKFTTTIKIPVFTNDELVTFAKTKGNLFRICGVVLIAFLLLLFVMFLMSYVNVVVASLLRSIILVYISLLYFKMYDFFYIFHQQHKMAKIKKLFSKKEELNVDKR